MWQSSRLSTLTAHIFAFGLKNRCDRFFDESNHLASIKNLGEFQWFGDCHYKKHEERGTPMTPPKTFPDEFVRKQE